MCLKNIGIRILDSYLYVAGPFSPQVTVDTATVLSNAKGLGGGFILFSLVCRRDH
jgi:hypothetical protein